METSVAYENLNRCPKCGDEMTEDKMGSGFVRHKTNNKCKWHNGEKDNIPPQRSSIPPVKKVTALLAIMACLLGGTSCKSPCDQYGPLDSSQRQFMESFGLADPQEREYAECKRSGCPIEKRRDQAAWWTQSHNRFIAADIEKIQQKTGKKEGKSPFLTVDQEKNAYEECVAKFTAQKNKLLAEWRKPEEEKEQARVAQLEKIRATVLVAQENLTGDVIQPFGELRWDDAMDDVEKKLSIVKNTAITMEHKPSEYSGGIVPLPMCTVLSLPNQRYEGHTPKLTACPVILSGISFELSVAFSYELGFCVANPAKTTSVFEIEDRSSFIRNCAEVSRKREEQIIEIFTKTVEERFREYGDPQKEQWLTLINGLNQNITNEEDRDKLRKAEEGLQQHVALMQTVSENNGTLIANATKEAEKAGVAASTKEFRQFPWAIKTVEMKSSSPIAPDKLDDLIAVIKQKYPNGKMVVANGMPENREGLFLEQDNRGFSFVMKWEPAKNGLSNVSLSYKRPDTLWSDIYKKYLEKNRTVP